MADRTPGPLWTGETLARLFHETYERLAPSHGYETRKASAVPWDDVPEPNRGLMVAVATEVLRAVYPAEGTPDREQIERALSPAISSRHPHVLRAAVDAVLELLALALVPAEVDARVARKIDLLRDERDALAARCDRLTQRCTDTDEQAFRLAKTVDRADGQIKALTAEVDALRSVVRRVTEGWSLRIDNMDVIPPFWENEDGEIDLTPAERDAINQATEQT